MSPLCVQPVIRFLQTAEEKEGLIQTRNSTALTQQLAKEVAGTPKVTPLFSEIFRRDVYTVAPAGQP